MTPTVLLLAACGGAHRDAESCDCGDLVAHGASRCDHGDCGPCMCLPKRGPDPDPEFTTVLSTGPGDALDWKAIDAALADGPVRIDFDAGTYPDRVDVLRTDPGPHRLLLDGGGHRAVVPGIHTTYDDVRRSYVTVRGFEVTDSRDKGIYWRAGDEVVIEDNVIHDNKGSPALSLDYANRTGLPSSSFVVRDNHVYNHAGECIYIGGSEGEPQPAHERLVIENNLVHNCWNSWDSKHDAINVKDRIASVEVVGNVVFEVNWGIEVASPGLIANNLVFDTESNGFHLADAWGQGLSGIELIDNAVLRAGERGVRVGTDRLGGDDIVFDGLTVQGSKKSAVIWAGDVGVSGTLDRVVLSGNDVGFDGWGTVDLDVGSCRVHANDQDADNSAAGAARDCEAGRPGFGDLEQPAGPDGVFFTDDDPWLVDGGAGL